MRKRLSMIAMLGAILLSACTSQALRQASVAKSETAPVARLQPGSTAETGDVGMRPPKVEPVTTQPPAATLTPTHTPWPTNTPAPTATPAPTRPSATSPTPAGPRPTAPLTPEALAPLAWPPPPLTNEQIAAVRGCDLTALAAQRYPKDLPAAKLQAAHTAVTPCDWAVLALAPCRPAPSPAPVRERQCLTHLDKLARVACQEPT